SLNPASNQPVWYIGDGILDGETNTVDFQQFANAGNIKLSTVVTSNIPGIRADPWFFRVLTLYAVAATIGPPGGEGRLLGEVRGVVGAGTLRFPFNLGMVYTAGVPNINAADQLDNYDLSVFTPDGANVYI